MKIVIIQVGKTKTEQLRQLEIEFHKRITPFAQIEVITLKDQGEADNEAGKKILRQKEATVIIDKIPKDSVVIALDERGKHFSSLEFARYIDQTKDNSDHICFIIGGVYGLDESVKDKAKVILSFSSFTFTHEMIRTLLIEQLYRAFTIIKGKKYHY